MEEDFGFIEGTLYGGDNMVVIASSEKLEEDDVDHAFICHLKNGKWDFWYEAFSAIKVCVIDAAETTLVVMGMAGEILVGDSRGFRREAVDRTDEGPNRLRPLNDMREIDQYVHVAGMRRQVFRRPVNTPGWERFDDGVLVPKTSREVAGFLTIDGFSGSEIYAAGYRGQLWYFDGKKWRKIDSPTNLRLEALCCVAGDSVIVVGDEGVILRGRDDRWDVVAQDLTDETFTDVETFQERIFISTEVGILYELQGDQLVGVDLGLGKEITTSNLHSDGRRLLSVGDRDLLVYDGMGWAEVPHPPLPAV
jgi:hypothetical protein